MPLIAVLVKIHLRTESTERDWIIQKDLDNYNDFVSFNKQR